MVDAEIASFITKFKYLCNAGINASLNLSSCDGKATVTLQAELGTIPIPLNVAQTPPKHRSPAYQRRIARRQMARQFGDVNHSEEAGTASTNVDTDILNEAVEPVLVDDDATTSDKALSSTSGYAEQACNSRNVDTIVNSEEKDEIDQEEAERDKLVEQVIVYLVPPSDCRQPLQSVSEVETEIRARFSSIGAEVKEIQIKTCKAGKFQSSLVKVTPTNIRKIWGRRLGLKSCTIVEFKQTKV